MGIETMHLVASAETRVTVVIAAATVVAIEVRVTAVVTVAAAVETAEAAAAIAVAEVVTVAVAAETVTTVVAIGVRGASDATSMMTVDQGRIAQVEMTKAAEIVARGVQPVVMMEAVDDLVRRVDARTSRNRSRSKLRHDVTGNHRNNACSKRRAWENGFNRSLGSRC